MAVLTNNPVNKNILTPVDFKFEIKRMPTFNYFVQSVNFPGIGLGDSGYKTPFSKLSIAGDHTTFDEISVSFKIDEDMKNYFELYDWMTGHGKPESFTQFANLDNNQPGDGFGLYSDATLIVLNNTMNPTISITFYDMYPNRLSGFTFDSTVNDITGLSATATFNYREYTYTRL